MRKIYVHEGAGHRIGSHVVVLAMDEKEAVELIRPALDSSGLQHEEINLESFDVDESQIVSFANGDY